MDNPFDMMGGDYATKSSNSIYNAMYERPALISALPQIDTKQVLDVGCGSGTLTGYLLEHGADVVGVDLSSELLNIAKERFGDRATFYQADLAKPVDFLEDNSFDLIVSSLALHYIEDWHTMFGELRRVLTDDGIIVFSTHHPSASRRWFDLGDYFKRTLVADVWTIGGEDIIVKNYHRSLTEMFNAFRTNGLVVDRLLEPQPLDKVKKINPKTYWRLNFREHFIIFKLMIA